MVKDRKVLAEQKAENDNTAWLATVKILKKEFRIEALVNSSSHEGAGYYVEAHDGSWTCSCPDYSYRERECKHIKAVKEEVQG